MDFPVYQARNVLAAIDYQKHKDLPLKTNSKGHTVYHKVFNKRGKNWTIVPERQLKHYEYIVSLQETIICACIEDELPKARKRGIKPDNPRNIAPNIATGPAPPTSELDLTVSLTLVPNVTERSKQLIDRFRFISLFKVVSVVLLRHRLLIRLGGLCNFSHK
ncbi:hypothetical protein LSAT2_031509 [Lamellibrachia satsuma]|nr:hypothetical protein LSAT2_031509 [Lamellibrachia satsuma]